MTIYGLKNLNQHISKGKHAGKFKSKVKYFVISASRF